MNRDLHMRCWTCGKRFPSIQIEKNCDECKSKFFSNYQYTNCNICGKQTLNSSYGLCCNCYKQTRYLDKKETEEYLYWR